MLISPPSKITILNIPCGSINQLPFWKSVNQHIHSLIRMFQIAKQCAEVSHLLYIQSHNTFKKILCDYLKWGLKLLMCSTARLPSMIFRTIFNPGLILCQSLAELIRAPSTSVITRGYYQTAYDSKCSSLHSNICLFFNIPLRLF